MHPMTQIAFFSRRCWLRSAAGAAVLLAAGVARAQFAMVPAPLTQGAPRASETEIEPEYRIDAARHVYAAFPMRVFRGRLPDQMYAVTSVETELDASGEVLNVSVVRNPAAEEVAPWVVAMIRRASPFPAPARLPGGTVRFIETWFVDKGGRFQLFTLSEGQK